MIFPLIRNGSPRVCGGFSDVVFLPCRTDGSLPEYGPPFFLGELSFSPVLWYKRTVCGVAGMKEENDADSGAQRDEGCTADRELPLAVFGKEDARGRGPGGIPGGQDTGF